MQVSDFKGVRSLGDVRSANHSVALGAEAAARVASNQSSSAFPESPTRFRWKVVILDFDHNISDSGSLVSDQSTRAIAILILRCLEVAVLARIQFLQYHPLCSAQCETCRLNQEREVDLVSCIGARWMIRSECRNEKVGFVVWEEARFPRNSSE